MKKRILTAVLIVLFSAPLLYLGGWYTVGFAAVVCFGSLFEMLKVGGKGKKWSIAVYIVVSICTVLMLFWNIITAYIDNPELLQQFQLPPTLEMRINIFTIVGYLLILLCTEVASQNFSIIDCFYVFVISVIIALASQGIIFVRMKYGLSAIAYIILVTVSCDMFAHIFGSKFGKHKLAPICSPKKSWEGAIAGCSLATVIGTLWFTLLPFVDYPVGKLIFVGFLLSLILSIGAVEGDLVFSSIKRQSNIKDFSNILPGHGGILDRVDSLLFNMLVFLLFFAIQGIL